MIDLFNNDTNQLIGSITDAELKVLVDRLEEESETDQDYYRRRSTCLATGQPPIICCNCCEPPWDRQTGSRSGGRNGPKRESLVTGSAAVMITSGA